jgi:lipopolysaccharide biosynthesis glycosyltransferase
LFNNSNLNIDNIFYFDPDITINKHWNHFIQWIEAGVALCEDVNSPIPEHHPRRVGWRSYYTTHNFNLKFKSDYYVNGGFIGLKRSNIEFLKTWQLAQELMALKIGSLTRSIFSNDAAELNNTPGFNYFDKTDQDALNVAVEATNLNVSIIGKEAMGFLLGDTLMYHNLGFSKPWRKNYSKRFLKGMKPGNGDLQFWEFLNNKPIIPFSKFVVQRKLIFIKLYRFLFRFYGAK